VIGGRDGRLLFTCESSICSSKRFCSFRSESFFFGTNIKVLCLNPVQSLPKGCPICWTLNLSNFLCELLVSKILFFKALLSNILANPSFIFPLKIQHLNLFPLVDRHSQQVDGSANDRTEDQRLGPLSFYGAGKWHRPRSLRQLRIGPGNYFSSTTCTLSAINKTRE